MSLQNQPPRKRPYRLKARADQQTATRLRITEAVVALHERVGPAKTTLADVAALAGVGRMTVYKHFPTEADLFRACGAHWSAQHPPPDFSDCVRLDDDARAACVLTRLYAHYRRTHAMLGKIQRDAPLLPALQEVVDAGWTPLLRQLETALTPDGLKSAERRRATAAARLALDLRTWETLTATGLGDARRGAATGAPAFGRLAARARPLRLDYAGEQR